MKLLSIFVAAIVFSSPLRAERFPATTVPVLDGKTTLTFIGVESFRVSSSSKFMLGADIFLPPFDDLTNPNGRIKCSVTNTLSPELSYENLESEFDGYWDRHEFGKRDSTTFRKLDRIQAKVAEVYGFKNVSGGIDYFRRFVVWVSNGETFVADMSCNAPFLVKDLKEQARSRFFMEITADLDQQPSSPVGW